MRRNPKAPSAGSTTRQAGSFARTTLALAFALLALAAIGASSALAAAPVLTIEAATEVGFTSALAKGEVDPEDHETNYRFEYTTQAQFEAEGFANAPQAGAGTLAAGAGATALEATLEGLNPATTYHLRLFAENSEAEQVEAIAPTFPTQTATAPAVAIEAATEIKFTTAHIEGTVDPEGGNVNPLGGAVPIAWELQINREGGGWEFAEGGVLFGAEAESPTAITVQKDLAGLQNGAAYEFRLRASRPGAEAETAAESFTTQTVTAPAASAADADSVTATVAHFSGTVEVVNADEAFNAFCRFEYIAEAAFQAAGETFTGAGQVPCAPNPVLGSESQPVSVGALAKGLQPNTVYHLRLAATNQGGTNASVAPDTFTTAPLGPTASDATSTPRSTEAVTLRAFVNPHSTPLSVCRFDYGLSAPDEGSAPCEVVPSGNSDVRVSALATGLQAGSRYRYRFVATNASGTDSHLTGSFESLQAPFEGSCANAARRAEQHSESLPDCRAYELVSPPEKNGGDIVADSQRSRAAADGSAFGFISLQGFSEPQGSGVATDYLSARSGSADPGSSGWSTHPITPRQDGLPFTSLLGANEPLYQGEMSEDLSRGITSAWSPLTADPGVANVDNLYLRTDLRQPGTGSYRLLSACPRCEETGESPLPALPGGPISVVAATNMRPFLAGASPDLSHVIFESRWNLTADAPAQPGSCFIAFGGGGCRARLYESDEGGIRLAGILPDGSAAPISIAGVGAGGTHRLWMTPHTISDGSDGHSRVFFTFPTNDGTTPNGEGFGGNLYARVDGASTAQLNASERSDCAGDPSCGGDGQPDPAPTAFVPANYLDAAADGERVFFITSQALSDDAPNNGQPKIYMYDATRPGSDPHNLTFLGTDMAGMIGASDDGRYAYLVSNRAITLWHDGATADVGPTPTANLTDDLASSTGWDLNLRQARVAPDGQHMLFRTSNGSGLAGADHGSCSGNPCNELYLYSAATDAIQCVSCNPSGAPTEANASDVVLTNTGGAQQSWHQNHAISADGRYAFFDTAAPLVPEDTNGAVDAYEFDSATGQPRLLSSGTDESPSYFLDASADGKDAFVLTRQRLLGWDTDDAYDVYDARVNGGFPEPTATTAPCSGEACRRSAPAAPAPRPDASATVQGAAKPPARRCPKGRRRVKGRHGKPRCVANKKRHQSHKHKRTADDNGRAGR